MSFELYFLNTVGWLFETGLIIPALLLLSIIPGALYTTWDAMKWEEFFQGLRDDAAKAQQEYYKGECV